MSERIRFSCTNGDDPTPMSEACGDVSTTIDNITVMVHQHNSFGHYICRCPECGVVQHRKISPEKVALLVESGAELEVTPQSRPDFLEQPTNEPPISPFEVERSIAFMKQLDDTELFVHLTEPDDA